MTPDIYLAAFFILLFAYFIRGITGFGSGLIAIPLLAHFLPLTFVVPMVLVLDFVASVVLSRHTRLQVRWDEIRILLPTTIVGILIGAFLLVNLPREPLLVGLGLFVIFFGLRYVFNVHGERPISRWWSVPTGLAGGLIGAMFGTGGPPYVVYLSHRLHDKTQLRGTLSGLFMLDGALRVITFLAIGLLLQSELLVSLLLALPLMGLGLYLGNRVHLGISHRQQLAVIGGLLLLSGGSLLWNAWG
ncbi:MAG: sulfite exporter TauE/SafE family protein [Gammaproteobacteria bacterium]|nr:sulfite exporter TauE/SafE family protein [Gammaproteobacteria bacterium]MCW8922125.1 sulfite exporter TauE/SafE family protein [Gammaproteobacteria bacterium]